MAEPNATAQAQPGVETQTLEGGDFSSLLQREFKPKSDQAKEAVETPSVLWPSRPCRTRR
jgi:type VI secretion system protein ImpC